MGGLSIGRQRYFLTIINICLILLAFIAVWWFWLNVFYNLGGPLPSGQSTGLAGFSLSTTQTNAFSPSSVFGQSSGNSFSSTTPNSNPFAPKSSPFSSGFGTSAAPVFSSSAFGSSTEATAAEPSIFGSSPSPFGANSSSIIFLF